MRTLLRSAIQNATVTGTTSGWLGRSIAGVLFASVIAASSRPMITSIRDAIRFQPLGYHERRVRQLGAFYSTLTQLRTQVAPQETLALITAGTNIDAALFANYYLYPQPLRIYAGRDAYRQAAGDPSRPPTIVAAGDLVERTTYAGIRDRELRRQPRLSGGLPLSDPRRHFLIPVATSIDGPPPDTYVTEATLQNPGASAAAVEITFFPSRRSVQLTMPPHSPASWYDLVFQQFGVMETGWLEVQSSAPVRAAFAFVNRGRADVVSLPLDLHPGIFAGNLPGHDTKLWLLNPTDRPIAATVGSKPILLQPRQLVARVQQGPLPPIQAQGVFAFLSTRDDAGRTRFLWPR